MTQVWQACFYTHVCYKSKSYSMETWLNEEFQTEIYRRAIDPYSYIFARVHRMDATYANQKTLSSEKQQDHIPKFKTKYNQSKQTAREPQICIRKWQGSWQAEYLVEPRTGFNLTY